MTRRTAPVPRRTRSVVATAIAGSLLLAGCGGDTSAAGAGGSAPSTAAGDGAVSVVTSTDVYGDLAATVGGDRAEVVAIIDDPAQDPHSYEASTRDQLTLQRADVVVQNGGGYDPFVETMLDAVGREGKTVVTAVEESEEYAAQTAAGETGDEHAEEEHAADEHAHEHGAADEHVWYDLATAEAVVTGLVEALSAADPDGAATFRTNGDALVVQLQQLREREEQLHAAVEGSGAVVTEPVPAHMLEALGVEDRTPAEFGEAMEEGQDVPVAALQEVLDLIGARQVDVLVYNEQTAGAQTEQVEAAARAAGVPVVPVTETLPEGKDYVTWMSDNLTALEGALTS
ncbi:metal ABC transporter substrate-binding protein [Kineococcus glutinatus]|uniref:Metal ABC transporter solute-binding protein n=1 Tax=Kineococcus glutinatus TaxID=1070872 RepID=A0ABP9H6R1_9ACTN